MTSTTRLWCGDVDWADAPATFCGALQLSEFGASEACQPEDYLRVRALATSSLEEALAAPVGTSFEETCSGSAHICDASLKFEVRTCNLCGYGDGHGHCVYVANATSRCQCRLPVSLNFSGDVQTSHLLPTVA